MNLALGAMSGIAFMVALLLIVLNCVVPIATWYDFIVGASIGVVVFAASITTLVGTIALSAWLSP